jgi:hypothetical protein
VPNLRILTRRLALSEAACYKLGKVLGWVLVAIIVVCVVIIVVALLKQVPSTPRTKYPTTHFSTTPSPSRPPVIYRNCDEAHKDGRWNIPSTDPAYRRELDHDGNGIACESRKPR